MGDYKINHSDKSYSIDVSRVSKSHEQDGCHSLTYMVKAFKCLHVLNYWTDFNETWPVSFMLQCI